MILSCSEHVDNALDDIVDTYGEFPVLEEVTSENADKTCNFCTERPVYEIERPASD
ncbi:CxxH/CxxC protein (TIGR04129 family) [Salsuginibacillus halophilus]|uniref:CxxH/CxxC protein (TIGR04129 family) n=1 Tax=Salsuginibacillus halophilus TaxID=517424 RepID=A0A2P8HIB8_9BACI|nr:CxxH/CxxC protein [Salsuginibacillus halophilus]PSL45910.1 CxxH/CxxC protein (TIGR04129 family) [Salsuginibacillus halophilus]